MFELTFRQRCTFPDRCQRKTEQSFTTGTTLRKIPELSLTSDVKWKNTFVVTWIFYDEDPLDGYWSTSVDLHPFSESCTTAQACVKVWRKNYMPEDCIVIIPRIPKSEELFNQSCEMDPVRSKDKWSWDSTCLEWWRRNDLWSLCRRIPPWLQDDLVLRMLLAWMPNTFSRQK